MSLFPDGKDRGSCSDLIQFGTLTDTIRPFAGGMKKANSPPPEEHPAPKCIHLDHE
jgi:hypothetical protein